MDDGTPFLNRDLSWLAFNDRVLAQAEDSRLKLMERVKFCAIFASNLDEFFMKRVGLAHRRLESPQTRDRRTPDGLSLQELLAQTRETVAAQQARQAACWLGELKPALAAAGIELKPYAELGAAARGALDEWFHANVFPVLTPLAVDPSHRFPFISNLSENYGLLVRDPAGDGPRTFARVKIPSVVSRFVRVPEEHAGGSGVSPAPAGEGVFVALDDLIARHLDVLFPGLTIERVTPFRITRSAAIEVDDDDEDIDDLLRQVEDELRRRRFASAVRLEAPRDADDGVLQFVTTHLMLDEEDVYLRDGPLEYDDLFQIASLPRPDLKEAPWTPVVPRELRGLPPLGRDRTRARLGVVLPDAEEDVEGTIFDRIRAGDILVHHPYDSFEHSVERFVAEAAEDEDVVAIKQTIYRTNPGSPFVRSLINAAERGKNVACLVELRARFDEDRNVSFARQLELAGVHVAYGVLGLKTHCKLSLVVRREPGPDGPVIRSYAHVGTGNYHPKTAQLYTDCGLLTCDPAITGDVAKVFNTLTGHAAEQDVRRLLVAPQSMRDGFVRLIEAEIRAAAAGRPARIVAKMNQLEDIVLTEKLCEAARAGVPVTVYVRGFCCLRPGVPGVSEGVRVVSVVGRFLEHSRVFHFADGREDPREGAFYIGSADWMYRNLSDRVEVAAPVDDPRAKAKLWQIFEVMAADRRNAWELEPDGRYRRISEKLGDTRPWSELPGTFASLMAVASENA